VIGHGPRCWCRTLAAVRIATKILLRVGMISLAIGVALSLVLGYSGSSQAAAIGNSLLMLTLFGSMPIFAAGGICWLILRDHRDATVE